MDDSAFDALTRTLVAPVSRRISVHGLAAGLLAALGLALGEPTGLAKKGRGNTNGKKKGCPRDRRCGNKCCKAEETCRDRKKGQCVHHCRDGKKNKGETDTDCGGTCVDPPSSFGTCGIGRACNADNDCFSRICERRASGRKECVFCRDSSDCPRTATNKPACIDNECFECSRDADCPRPGQPPENNKCVAPLAGGCPHDQPCVCRECVRDADCPQGQFCDEENECLGAGNCANGVRDGDETDVDCGGSCRPCGIAKLCGENDDCETGHCGAADLGDGNGLRRQCVECFRDEHCPGGAVCSGHFCDD